jgi:hypothetical protein
MKSNFYSKTFNKSKLFLKDTLGSFKRTFVFSRNKNFKRQTNNSKFFNYKFLFLCPLIIGPKFLSMQDKNPVSDLTGQEIIRGEYENKIRIFSSIEKRFLIFGKNEKQMSYFRFLDSLIPFQFIKTLPDEEVEKILMGKPHFSKIMHKIDINKDNFINFEEYIILSVLMTVSFRHYLKKFPSGKATRENLVDFLMTKISEIESLKITNKSRFDGRVIKTDYNTLYRNMVDFISFAFPKSVEVDLNKDFSSFIFDVYNLILFYEFYRIPASGENKISRKNFAHVLASYTNIYKSKEVMARLNSGEIDVSGDISLDEYLTFFWFLRQLKNEKNQIFSKHLTVKDLKDQINRLIPQMQDPGFKVKKEISEKTLKLLIDLYDEDGEKNF